jgi:DNA transposition AAA+ family ATPase
MPTALKVPTIHLNGSDGETLIEDLQTVSDSLNTAISLLMQNAPHGRDYYVQEGDALKTATLEHISRIDRLRGVDFELKEIMSGIQQQLDFRKINYR